MLLDFFLFKVVRVTPKTCCWPANGREHGFQLLRCREGAELLCMSWGIQALVPIAFVGDLPTRHLHVGTAPSQMVSCVLRARIPQSGCLAPLSTICIIIAPILHIVVYHVQNACFHFVLWHLTCMLEHLSCIARAVEHHQRCSWYRRNAWIHTVNMYDWVKWSIGCYMVDLPVYAHGGVLSPCSLSAVCAPGHASWIIHWNWL